MRVGSEVGLIVGFRVGLGMGPRVVSPGGGCLSDRRRWRLFNIFEASIFERPTELMRQRGHVVKLLANPTAATTFSDELEIRSGVLSEFFDQREQQRFRGLLAPTLNTAVCLIDPPSDEVVP